MPLEYRILPQAQADLEVLQEWWKRERPAARFDLKRAYQEAMGRLLENPGMGRPYQHRRVKNVRSFALHPRTPYRIFYAVTDSQLVVLAIWSSLRRQGPALPNI